jgi:guanylate kinase
MAGKLFVVSGPSGVGKGTLLARVLDELDDLRVTVSATTRQPRMGEVDTVNYFFYSTEEFEKLIAQDGLLEWASVHGAFYGTLKSEVLSAFDAGYDVVLEIDLQGARQVRLKYPQAILIFIKPPSLAVLETRLRERGTEDEASISRRLATAVEEIAAAHEYDKVIVNDDLEVAVQELLAFIKDCRNTGATLD